MILDLEKRAAEVKASVVALNKANEQGVNAPEGTLATDTIKAHILTDMRESVTRVDAMRKGGKDRRPVDVSWAQFIQERWGFSPSDNGSPDSFYAALGINPSYHSLEHLNSFPEFQEGYRWLVPEIIRDAIRLGLRRAPIYSRLTAAEENVAQPSVIMPVINMSDVPVRKIGEMESIPTGTVSFGQKTVGLQKVGTGIKITDAVNQFVSLNILALYLQDVGVKIGLGLDYLAVDTLINGDQADGSLSAPVIGVYTQNSLVYKDLLRAWIRMGRIGRAPKRMLSNEDIAIDILELPEFKGLNGLATVQTKIQMDDNAIPTSQGYSVHGAMPSANQIMLVDTSSALIKLNASALRIEADRIVEKGLNATYVSIHTGFANLFRDGRLIIDKSLAFSTNGFPTWMDVAAAENKPFGS